MGSTDTIESAMKTVRDTVTGVSDGLNPEIDSVLDQLQEAIVKKVNNPEEATLVETAASAMGLMLYGAAEEKQAEDAVEETKEKHAVADENRGAPGKETNKPLGSAGKTKSHPAVTDEFMMWLDTVVEAPKGKIEEVAGIIISEISPLANERNQSVGRRFP